MIDRSSSCLIFSERYGNTCLTLEMLVVWELQTRWVITNHPWMGIFFTHIKVIMKIFIIITKRCHPSDHHLNFSNKKKTMLYSWSNKCCCHRWKVKFINQYNTIRWNTSWILPNFVSCTIFFALYAFIYYMQRLFFHLTFFLMCSIEFSGLSEICSYNDSAANAVVTFV